MSHVIAFSHRKAFVGAMGRLKHPEQTVKAGRFFQDVAHFCQINTPLKIGGNAAFPDYAALFVAYC